MAANVIQKAAYHLNTTLLRTSAFRVGYAYGTVEDADLAALGWEVNDDDVSEWHSQIADYCGSDPVDKKVFRTAWSLR